jgi:hypothetical protein
MSYCKITSSQAVHIRALVNEHHLKLREVREQFPDYAVLSLPQIHRIANGTNWGRVTGMSGPRSNPSPSKENR